MRDLRVSVTDRCNFRCLYCLPETEAAENFYRGRWANLPDSTPIQRQWAPRSTILTFEEIERVVRIAVDLGIDKIRLTGGEPLLRQDFEHLVERIGRIDGIADLALTTNGFFFRRKAKLLKDAGLRRVSFSLDSLDRENFRKITGRDGLNEVLDSIECAVELGLQPVKVNAVVIRGVNDHEIASLAEFGLSRGLSMRFIEFMPLDSKRAWMKELVVPATEILAAIQKRFELHPVQSANPSETAMRWRLADLEGRATASPSSRNPAPGGTSYRESVPGLDTPARAEIGIIAPVSQPFCGHCNRLRLTADGKIRTCLFSIVEHDLRGRLRGGAGDYELGDYLREVVWQKEAGHKIGQPDFVPPQRSMSCIGG
jgi:cyclic pyranopterin phosphate synthase